MNILLYTYSILGLLFVVPSTSAIDKDDNELYTDIVPNSTRHSARRRLGGMENQKGKGMMSHRSTVMMKEGKGVSGRSSSHGSNRSRSGSSSSSMAMSMMGSKGMMSSSGAMSMVSSKKYVMHVNNRPAPTTTERCSAGVVPSSSTNMDSDEFQFVHCSDNEEIFEVQAYIGFDGEPKSLTGCELNILEEAWKAIYNELTYLRCDIEFRKVLDVTFTFFDDSDDTDDSIDRPFRRRLAQSNIDGAAEMIMLRKCRNCPRNRRAFGIPSDGIRQRHLSLISSNNQEYNNDKEDIHRILGNNRGTYDASEDEDNVCICPIDLNHNRDGRTAPSIHEFRAAFNSVLHQLVEKGKLKHVTELELVEEIIPEFDTQQKRKYYYND